jgi:xanthine dehydrogenase YagS FAD-binding subunit
MRNFDYVKATTLEAAVSAAGQGGVALMAGGTDLLPLMKDDIVSPRALVDITGLAQLDSIKERGDTVRIGAMSTLSDIGGNALIAARYPALAQACQLAATPQLRNMSSIGGNLLQQPRCWYYRGEHDCWLKGGEVCFARNGENEHHAIFLNSPAESRCVSVHPSDPAVALLLFDALVRMETSQGGIEVPLRDLYNVPTPERRNSFSLPAGAVITEIVLDPIAGGRSVYLKAMPRASWAFALVSVGLYVRVEAGRIEDARLALGGVAPIPLRFEEVEAEMVGQDASRLDADALADSLVARATPLSQNGYKVPLLRGLFKQALSQVMT